MAVSLTGPAERESGATSRKRTKPEITGVFVMVDMFDCCTEEDSGLDLQHNYIQ